MADARIFADLKNDHDKHRVLLEKLGLTREDGDDRRALFEELRRELQAHAAAEEETLYATMLAQPDLREDARHAVSEHKEIDDFLGELVSTDMADGAWLETFEKMKHRYLHHIDEEEEDMFPEAEAALSDRVEEQLADTFEQRKPEELARAVDEKPGDARD